MLHKDDAGDQVIRGVETACLAPQRCNSCRGQVGLT